MGRVNKRKNVKWREYIELLQEDYTPYYKWFWEGNASIYWAGIYGHSDYNKSYVCPNTNYYWNRCKKLMDKYKKARGTCV
ncbi:MAG: hypothetical protein FWE23_06705 [Chitinivibrionia bacterium]|nr:hypothetical protein [Chitinivibrionia bacterium]